MKADIIGGPGAGKSTIAALLAQLVAESYGKTVRPQVVGIATVPRSAVVMSLCGLKKESIFRAQSLVEIGGEPEDAESKRKAKPGIIGGLQRRDVVILDDATDPYLLAVETFLKTANGFRRQDSKGENESPNMTPGGWRSVNARYEGATVGAAFRVGAHIIMVSREGESFYFDPDQGRMPAMAGKPRGQSESGSQSDLILRLYGGTHSKYRLPGDRLLYVESDGAFLATGEARCLPSIKSDRDWRYLRKMLKDLLRDSLVKTLKLDAENRAAWLARTPEPDRWPEAAHSSNEGEVLLLIDETGDLLMRYGLDGQSADVKGKRARLLKEIFGVTTPALFKESPRLTPPVIRAGLKILEERLAADAEEQRRAEAARIAEIEAKGKA